MRVSASPSSTDQQIVLSDGRRLGYAEYGDPSGRQVLLFHGVPGSRLLRHPDDSIASALGVRLIVPDRPGMGLSDPKPGRGFLDWPADVLELADCLGLERFAVAGFSGGAPYAAACGLALPQRLTALGIISGVGQLDASDALIGMLSSNRIGYVVGRRMPWFLWRWVFGLYYGSVRQHPEQLAQLNEQEPEADRLIFTEPGVRQMFTKTFAEAFRQGTAGAAWEGWLLARPWGFALSGVTVPTHLWHGEADVVATPAMGRHMAEQLPNCHARFLTGEGHLVLISYWREILAALAGHK